MGEMLEVILSLGLLYFFIGAVSLLALCRAAAHGDCPQRASPLNRDICAEKRQPMLSTLWR